jgi:hypothetical protein
MGLPAYSQPVLLGMLLLFGGYLVYEVARWRGGNRSELTVGQFRRRIAGGLLLELDLLMWYAAGPLMSGRPPAQRLLYLLFATLFVLLPMLLAVREAAFVARQYVRWKSDLIRNMAQGDSGERRSG